MRRRTFKGRDEMRRRTFKGSQKCKETVELCRFIIKIARKVSMKNEPSLQQLDLFFRNLLSIYWRILIYGESAITLDCLTETLFRKDQKYMDERLGLEVEVQRIYSGD